MLPGFDVAPVFSTALCDADHALLTSLNKSEVRPASSCITDTLFLLSNSEVVCLEGLWSPGQVEVAI